MADKFTLDVDQASELKHAFKRNGWTNEDIKMLTEGNLLGEHLGVIRGTHKITTLSLLRPLSVVTLPGTDEFVAQEVFTQGEPLHGSSVTGMNEWFERVFLPKVEKKVKASVLRIYELGLSCSDPRIIRELGGEGAIETNLFHLWCLLKRHKRGAGGPLIMNRRISNNLFIRGVDDVLWSVSAQWDFEASGWDLAAFRTDRLSGAPSGLRVFAPEANPQP